MTVNYHIRQRKSSQLKHWNWWTKEKFCLNYMVIKHSSWHFFQVSVSSRYSRDAVGALCGVVTHFLAFQCTEFVFSVGLNRLVSVKADSTAETSEPSPDYSWQKPACELFRHIKYWKPGVSVSHTEREGRDGRDADVGEDTKGQRRRGKSQRTAGLRGNNTSGTLGGRHMSRDGGREGGTGREHPKVRQGEPECLNQALVLSVTGEAGPV